MAALNQRRALTAVLGLILGSACGDPVKDETYRGQPLYTIQGQIHGASYDVDLANPVVRISLFWNPAGTTGAQFAELKEEVSTSTQAVVPSNWTMNIFDPPGDDMLFTTPSGARYGIGRILVYPDTNGNGRWDPDEPIVGPDLSTGVGTDKGHVVLYAPEDVASSDSPTSLPLRAGFHMGRFPLICAGRPPIAESMPCPSVSLGASCETDSDCGAFTCLGKSEMHDFLGFIWPNGACAVHVGTCVPSDGNLVNSETDGYFLRACEHDSDCGRPWPYVCDETEHACMPDGLQDITLSAFPLTDVGGACVPTDGGMPPPPDGGMLPPPLPDGGRPPPPDGGLPPPPPFPDGGRPPPPPPPP